MVFKRKPKVFNPKFEVVSCFCEYEDTILLLRLKHDKFQGGRWGVPAGKVENKEELQAAMIREMKEETKLILTESALLHLGKVYIKFSEFDFIYHMYKSIFTQKPDVMIDPKEHIDYRWLKPADALSMDLIQDEDVCIKMW